MEMVDMDITRFGFSDPKSRSVNICSAFKSWIIFDVGCFYILRKCHSCFFNMYLVFFDTTSQYVVIYSQYLVNIWSIFGPLDSYPLE